MKNIFPLFGILTVVGIGIAMLQMFVKSIPLIIGIMAVSTVIFLSLLLLPTKWAMDSVEGENRRLMEFHRVIQFLFFIIVLAGVGLMIWGNT